MPIKHRHLYIRAWLTGIALGMLPLGLLPVLPPPWFTVWMLLLALALTVMPGRPIVCGCAGLLLGFAVALLHGHALQSRRLPSACEGSNAVAVGTVYSLPRFSRMPSGDQRQRFELRVEALTPSHCSGPRRLLLSHYDALPLVPGEYWLLPVKLRRPWGLSNPGSFNMQAWYASTGIDAVGRVGRDGAQRLAAAAGVETLHHRLRQQVSRRIAGAGLSADGTAIIQAITVADRSGMNHALWSVLQGFGVSHLAVISGLHIGMVAGLAYGLGNFFDRLRWTGGILRGTGFTGPGLALLAGAGYALLAGFSVSTQRALFMLACFLAATVCRRAANSWNALRWAFLMVLLINPLASLASGFWLSFVAVACLLWFSSVRAGAARLAGIGGTHLYMGLAMLPLSAWWFGGASVASAVANLALIPLVSLYVVPLALLGVACALLGSGLDAWFWRMAAWPLDTLVGSAQSLLQESGAWLYPGLSSEPLALVLGMAAVALLAPRGAPALRGLGLLLLLPSLLPVRTPPDHDEGLRVTSLDVGQGTAVVINHGAHALLYDTGGGDPAGATLAHSVVLPYLRRQGLRELDMLVLSHPDADHSAGAGAVLQAMPVARVRYSSGKPPRGDSLRCEAGEVWQWPGGVIFRFLAPAEGEALGSNDGSCVLQVRYAGHRLLLPGDIEAPRERDVLRYWGRDVLRSDWLLAAHHGSRSSSAPSWLKAVRPEQVVFSRGYQNRFGHPHAEVTARLAVSGVEVHDTARDGALTFTFRPGEAVRVETYRARQQRFWK